MSLNPILTRTQILSNHLRNRRYSTMAKRALVFLAPGAEEMEAVIAIDVLRRGGVEVTVAGLPDDANVACSRGVNIKPDISIENAQSKGPYDAIVLPGGLGGSKALAACQKVGDLIKEQEKSGRITAAICAAPTAIKAHGAYIGKSLTSYPAMQAELAEGGHYKYLQDEVVIDGTLITSRGPGTAFKFALTLVDKLVSREKACEVAKAMLVNY